MKHEDSLTESLPITVPLALHEDMSAAVSEKFAISYLCGAAIVGATLMPRTSIARDRLIASGEARIVLAHHGLTLGRSLKESEREPIEGVRKVLERFDRTGKFV